MTIDIDKFCQYFINVQFWKSFTFLRFSLLKQLLNSKKKAWKKQSILPTRRTSLILGSSGHCPSFVCFMFSTIFLINAWLLFSFLAIRISKTNHKALKGKRRYERERERKGERNIIFKIKGRWQLWNTIYQCFRQPAKHLTSCTYW